MSGDWAWFRVDYQFAHITCQLVDPVWFLRTMRGRWLLWGQSAWGWAGRGFLSTGLPLAWLWSDTHRGFGWHVYGRGTELKEGIPVGFTLQ